MLNFHKLNDMIEDLWSRHHLRPHSY
jgi:hypothetical protein